MNCETFRPPQDTAPNSNSLPQTLIDALNSNPTYASRIHQSIIGCHPSVNLTEYTIVHEFWHVVNDISGGYLSEQIDGTTTRPILDEAVFCSINSPFVPGTTTILCPAKFTWGKTYVVMGNVVRDGQIIWIRGSRGWGSADPTSASNLTSFQQHYLESNADIYTQKLETAADMFLNWVYRSTSDFFPPNPNVIPGSWEGFWNTSWQSTDIRWGSCTAGCNDLSYPGNKRYNWMVLVMSNLP